MPKELRPHQEKAVQELSTGKILWGGTGAGKSFTAAMYYVRKEAPKPVYVITTAKKRDSLDWEEEFAELGIGKKHSLHGILVVDSWNNIARYKDVRDAFFIFDEQRLVGRGSWSRNFIRISKRNTWIVLSATPGDTWMDYVPVFIANGFYKNRTEFESEHVVWVPWSKFPKVDRYVNTGRLIRQRHELLVEMPYKKHTKRIHKTIPVEFDKELFQNSMKNRWNPFKDEPIRDIAGLFSVLRRIVNADPSRMDAVRKTLANHPKAIIFYNFNYELEALRTLADDGLTVAEWNGHKHEPVPTTDRWVYLVQYVAGAEGWNCITTDTTIFYSLTYSYKNWQQAQGRTDRMNTPYSDLFYYTLLGRDSLDTAIARSLNSKKDFNEARYVKKIWG